MFTLLAIGLIVLLIFLARQMNEQDRPIYTEDEQTDQTWRLVLHVRQHLKLVTFLLGGIMVMLGVIADRI